MNYNDISKRRIFAFGKNEPEQQTKQQVIGNLYKLLTSDFENKLGDLPLEYFEALAIVIDMLEKEGDTE